MKPLKIILCFAVICISQLSALTSAVYAVDPLESPNNKFGMHIISATHEEIDPVRDLVNTNGDWGYVTLLIESKDRDENKWQQVFDNLRRKHLIPIVRIATEPVGNYWRRPNEGEEHQWAEFLDKLRWPIKNRYVIIYNEPNHATEWGNTVDAKDYARTLDKTIAALKQRSPDFFVINAGFDASAPQKLPAYQDELNFLKAMNEEVPGIFDRIDGWSSHSYPNPGFKGSPDSTGRISVRAFEWETAILKSTFNVKRDLPVFITETGWKHAEGIKNEVGLPDADQTAQYYKKAFEIVWNNPQVIAVTPFLLNYQDSPFDHFSFKKPDGKKQDSKLIKDVLGEESKFYPQYEVLRNMTKVAGRPIQENNFQVMNTDFLKTAVIGETYEVTLKVRNTGQSIWNEYDQIELTSLSGAEEFGFTKVEIPQNQKIEPNGEFTFQFPIKLETSGTHKLILTLTSQNMTFNSTPASFITNVTTPANITIHSDLKWKGSPKGNDYTLTISSAVSNAVVKLSLGDNGKSETQQLKALVPDIVYDFTLQKPYYQSKTIHQKIQAGNNYLDFGALQPDITSAILRPDVILQFISN